LLRTLTRAVLGVITAEEFDREKAKILT